MNEKLQRHVGAYSVFCFKSKSNQEANHQWIKAADKRSCLPQTSQYALATQVTLTTTPPRKSEKERVLSTILPFRSMINCTGSSHIRPLNCCWYCFRTEQQTPMHIGDDATQPHRPTELQRKNRWFCSKCGWVLLSLCGHSTYDSHH